MRREGEDVSGALCQFPLCTCTYSMVRQVGAPYKTYIEKSLVLANARTEEPVIDKNDKNTVRFEVQDLTREMAFTAEGEVSKMCVRDL